MLLGVVVTLGLPLTLWRVTSPVPTEPPLVELEDPVTPEVPVVPRVVAPPERVFALLPEVPVEVVVLRLTVPVLMSRVVVLVELVPVERFT